MMRSIVVFLILLTLFGGAASAQTGGQFCVRAFEDRDGSGTLDAGEPLLTTGISADLLNAENVVVASALLAESPTAAQGVICFQFLAPGQYSMIITSAAYSPTTPNTVTASISEGTLPTVVEFGGQRLAIQPTAAALAPSSDLAGFINLDRDSLPRIVLGLLGALMAVAVMIVLGSLIYVFFLRPRQQAAPAYYPPPTAAKPPTTGGIKPVVKDSDEPA
jgi:hypothetical protein